MDKDEEIELTSGRDTKLHSHAFDRTPTQDFLEGLSDVERVTIVTTTYTAKYQDDIILADSTAGAFTITLPQSRLGKRFTIVRTAGAGNITVTPVSGLLNGAASATISSSYTPLRIKAIGLNYFNV